ncbi:DUF2777 domain-containing protein [Bacillus sp. FJAT-49736]|uniref:DUF2777 domain-containing protein n=1 Tax=Bacillus sp. FJAT-49736 TaxID=2833582 RepID=UPI001BC95161|nr:DUF2777 domain-containing protein [Bacillus sp. FJAT-49736]MBS4172018.1 DUF2777 domain-containing protein [Bacillus sp. FJAT-49736]
MDHQHREQLIRNQDRAFITGSIENINDQWVFFDDETDEAFMLEEYFAQEVEIFHRQQWIKGVLEGDGKITMPNSTFFLHDQLKIRIRKQLTFAFEILLNELKDDALLYFIHNLNQLEFSVYDCIYCHNQLSYLAQEEKQNGVNFLIFDNGENICSIQHHFKYEQDSQDRFEFTLSTGKRTIVEKVSNM